jgi:SAM-dependent methyltransferase
MPYHKYVFNSEKRIFIGNFEEMYRAEDIENFDSWKQEDLKHLGKQISLTVLNQYNFSSILDIGCGKGTFTHLLKKNNNIVTGIDISSTAIKKATEKYTDINFTNSIIDDVLKNKNLDLIIMMEVLSYLENWKEIIKNVSCSCNYVFISLYLPNNPIGFIKSFIELKEEINKYFIIKTEILWNNEELIILGYNKNRQFRGDIN